MKLLTRAEELILLAVWKKEKNAYCIPIRDQLSEITGENWSLGSIYMPLDRLVKKEAIFVSNTSGLSITKISEKMVRKGQFAGMHWWNPPHLIPLVEVIKGDKTTEETTKLVMDLSARLGKKPVLVLKDAPASLPYPHPQERLLPVQRYGAPPGIGRIATGFR